MKLWITSRLLGIAAIGLASLTLTALAATGNSNSNAFLAENDAAMRRMMAGMHVEPSGVIDRDFAAMMIPHHQGAVDMARTELRYGSNERLRRLAQEIVVAQQQEISVMQSVLQDELPTVAPTPTK